MDYSKVQKIMALQTKVQTMQAEIALIRISRQGTYFKISVDGVGDLVSVEEVANASGVLDEICALQKQAALEARAIASEKMKAAIGDLSVNV